MRDVLLTVVVAGLVPVALLRPFAGLLAFTWLAFFRPQEMCWSFAREAPFSLAIAVALVAGLLLGRRIGRPFTREERVVRVELPTLFMILFWVATGFSAVFGVDPAASRAPFATLTKIVFVALLGSGLCGTRERVRQMLTVVAFSLGALAVKTVWFAVRTGEYRIFNGPGGMMADNNDFGLALVMGLALLVGVMRQERVVAAKAVAALTAAACAATVFFTHSRSGFVALVLVVILALLAMRRRAIAFVVAPAVLGAIFLLVPGGTLTRLTSVWNGAPDESAAARLVAFRKALHMAAEEPLFGVGPGNFTAMWAEVPPRVDAPPIVVHNTFLQVLAESGGVGLALFLAMFGTAIAGLARVPAEVAWRASWAQAALLALAGFGAGAMFLSRVNFDLTYVLVGMVPAIVRARDEGRGPAASPAARVGLPWRATAQAGGAG